MTIDLTNPTDGRARDKFGRIWVTTARGAAETGMPEAAIRDWTRRKLIDGQLVLGRRWYRLDQLQALEAAAYLRDRRRRAAQPVDDQTSETSQSDHRHHGTPLVDAAQKQRTCFVDTVDEGPCSRQAETHAQWNICDLHIGEIVCTYRAYTRRGVELADQQQTYTVTHLPEAERMRDAGPVEHVYYIRFGDRVKIGFSSNLDTRLTALPHDEVLAIEPGGRQLEQMRHTQFGVARIYANREWFVLTDELRDHCVMLVQHYGQPHTFLRPRRPPSRLLPT